MRRSMLRGGEGPLLEGWMLLGVLLVGGGRRGSGVPMRAGGMRRLMRMTS